VQVGHTVVQLEHPVVQLGHPLVQLGHPKTSRPYSLVTRTVPGSHQIPGQGKLVEAVSTGWQGAGCGQGLAAEALPPVTAARMACRALWSALTPLQLGSDMLTGSYGQR
jgi:hypothetical protein